MYPHTYRYDLESFFYVFLYVAICPKEIDGEKSSKLPATSRLLKWESDEAQHLIHAVHKKPDMEPEGFHKVLEEFSPEFVGLKGLAKTLRAILFPMKDGEIWTWTDMSVVGTNKLYDDMIAAFDSALVKLWTV